MDTDLIARIRRSAPPPSRAFDVAAAGRRTRRRRATSGAAATVAIVGAVMAAAVLLPPPVDAPRIDDVAGPHGQQQIDAVHACGTAPILEDLDDASRVADEIVLFAGCPAEPLPPDRAAGPYMGLARGMSADETQPAQIAELYLDGLTRAEVEDGYSLALFDLGLHHHPFTVEHDDDVVTVDFPPEALEVNNITTSTASTTVIEEISAQFLQLPTVADVRFTVEGSCEAFAAALERVDCRL